MIEALLTTDVMLSAFGSQIHLFQEPENVAQTLDPAVLATTSQQHLFDMIRYRSVSSSALLYAVWYIESSTQVPMDIRLCQRTVFASQERMEQSWTVLPRS